MLVRPSDNTPFACHLTPNWNHVTGNLHSVRPAKECALPGASVCWPCWWSCERARLETGFRRMKKKTIWLGVGFVVLACWTIAKLHNGFDLVLFACGKAAIAAKPKRHHSTENRVAERSSGKAHGQISGGSSLDRLEKIGILLSAVYSCPVLLTPRHPCFFQCCSKACRAARNFECFSSTTFLASAKLSCCPVSMDKLPVASKCSCVALENSSKRSLAV